MSDRKMRGALSFRLAACAALVLFAGHAVLLASSPIGEVRAALHDILSVLESGLAAACLYYAGRRLAEQNAPRRVAYAWLALSAGMNFLALGNTIWAVEEVLLHRVSAAVRADVFFPFYYVFFLIGLVFVPFSSLRRRQWLKLVVDVTIVSVAALLAYWALMVGPISHKPDGDMLTLAMVLLYPVFDAGLFCAALILLLRFTPEDGRRTMILLVLGTACIAAADTLHNYQLVSGTLDSASLAELPYSAGWLLAGLAGVARLQTRPRSLSARDTAVGRARGLRYGQWSIYLAYVWLLAACALLVRSQQTDLSGDNFQLLAGGVAAIVILVLIRQALMWNENSRLTVRLQVELSERVRQADINATMAQLASALISSTTFDDLCALVLEQAKRLTGSQCGFVGYVDAKTGNMIIPNPEPEIWGICDVAGNAVILKDSDGPWRQVSETRRPIVANDPAQFPTAGATNGSAAPIEKFLGVPAAIADMLVGQVAVANPGRDYDRDDLVLLMRVAALYALAVQQRRAEVALVTARDELEKRVEERTVELVQANDALRQEAMQLEQIQNELRYMSAHDGLTGLFNRAFFDRELTRLELGGQYPISLIMVDIDHLKVINDTLGHAQGDELLKQAAVLLRRTFRAEDVVARVGGDEFAVVLPGASAISADAAVQRLRENLVLANLTSVGRIELSIGVVTAESSEPLGEALRRADALMYQDKLLHGATDRRIDQL